jgi:hypothetical protein
MKNAKPFSAALVTVLMAACARTQVQPVASHVISNAAAVDRICIIENARVASKEFLGTYQSVLQQRGYKVEVISGGKAYSLDRCPYVSEYTAFFHWDMVFYLRAAELRIYKDGKPAGRAVYQSRNSRFISEEEALTRMVNQMLPK